MHWSLLPEWQLFGLSVEYSRVVMATWIAMALVVSALYLTLRRMSLQPAGLQNAVEWLHDAWSGLGGSVMGPAVATYLPFVFSIFFFVFASNYLGMIPGMVAPTANLNTPLALALVVFLSFLALSIIHQGVGGFLKHLMGPIPILAPIMMPIEIISLLARPFSLTLRLFANMTAGHMLTAVLFSLAGPAAILWMGFESLITCWIQAAVFSLLTLIYFAEAVTHAPEHH